MESSYNRQSNETNKSITAPQKKHRKIRFTPEQDNIIKQMAENISSPNWKEIAKKIPGKTAKQYRERYQHFLAPSIKRNPWTIEEDALLIQYHQLYGPDWAKIADFFPGRTNNDVKNRYNAHLKNKELDIFLAVMNSK